ncbi:hypothetical protein R6Q59_014251 [Mikania micrantha]
MASGSNVEYVGPWGNPWKFLTNDGKITSIILTNDEKTIHSLKFAYTDKDGNDLNAGPFGTPLPTPRLIEFSDGEILVETSGTFGMCANHQVKVIKSLTFKTNKGVYGPFGDASGTAFSMNGVFEGFFGNAGKVIYVFGAILRV